MVVSGELEVTVDLVLSELFPGSAAQLPPGDAKVNPKHSTLDPKP